MSRSLKILYIILRFVFTRNSSYVYCRLARLTGTFKNHLDYRMWLERYQTVSIRSFSFVKGQQAFEIKPVNVLPRSPKMNIYQTDTAIFLATKYEKIIMACCYLNFYKYFFHFELLTSNTMKNENIHLNSWHHSHKKQKDGLETRAVLLIFSLELEISGVAIERIHQTSEKWWLLWGIAKRKWVWGCFSQLLLLWLWCQHFWGSSEDC